MLRLAWICALILTTLGGCSWFGGGQRPPAAANIERAEASSRGDQTPKAQAPVNADESNYAEAAVSDVGGALPPAMSEVPPAAEQAASAETSGPADAPVASDLQLASIGSVAFEQLKAKSRLSADFRSHSLVRCVAGRLISALPDDERLLDWEILVFDEPGVFAFALPGARIGVHSQLLEVARTEGELAGAISHVLGHLRAGHLAERLADAIPIEDAEVAVHVLGGTETAAASRKVYSMLGLGHRVGAVVAFSEAHEAQTDVAALEILLGAGYRLEDARAWWRAVGAAPSAQLWLTQHPSAGARLAALEAVSETEEVKPKIWCADAG